MVSEWLNTPACPFRSPRHVSVVPICTHSDAHDKFLVLLIITPSLTFSGRLYVLSLLVEIEVSGFAT